MSFLVLVWLVGLLWFWQIMVLVGFSGLLFVCLFVCLFVFPFLMFKRIQSYLALILTL